MSSPNAPVKTPLGQQELRQRTQGLGQRHRTVLLLVDGRRPLAEVLSMAHQAGATAAHFEELVRLGMIELPVPPPPEPPLPVPEPPVDEAASQARAPDDAPLAEASAIPLAPAATPEPPADSKDAGPPADAEIAAPVPPPAPPEPARGVRRRAGSTSRPASPGRASTVRSVATGSDATPPTVTPAASGPAFVVAVAAAPPEPDPSSEDDRKLDEVRRLLVEVLRGDTLLQRLLAPARVHQARTQDELIALVWEIERGRTHARRKRVQLIGLQRARELLGMGNTLVAEDTLPFEPSRYPAD